MCRVAFRAASCVCRSSSKADALWGTCVGYYTQQRRSQCKEGRPTSTEAGRFDACNENNRYVVAYEGSALRSVSERDKKTKMPG